MKNLFLWGNLNGRCFFTTLLQGWLSDETVPVAEAAGAAADIATARKSSKYPAILPSYCFLSMAFGPINQDGPAFINLRGHRLANISGDDREITFLFQRLSVAIQRFHAIAFVAPFPPKKNICED